MPVSVVKKASANVSTLQHLKNGLHHRDIFGNEADGPPFTFGIAVITKHDSGGTAAKVPGNVYVIVTEGEVSLEDAAKPGGISVLEPGDVARVDKVLYVAQHEFGSDQKENII
ncbi:uncharacterized protein LACBIDRAFT_329944 [Laccaria bicolor S238N-H82]|uniref:Predicted protein n=1 Tax=Laccaria bicolor (strain S238N-H82 / ATCC MYA-4686) TaxID=486041 RepID=B0DJP6_LACBS|nr:uncharacterized protein LACBIDRAFT_329944 [Laccaria bicolor S238N-H82]EDR05155.1 predicted protein [Laccaria bicolor S238N-H82]|eukprot:XP_001884120.1 predicted protein [Laccaria bicolor S238N-H82]